MVTQQRLTDPIRPDPIRSSRSFPLRAGMLRGDQRVLCGVGLGGLSLSGVLDRIRGAQVG